ncbi:ABC transporter permease [bacterium (Candidatus Blackallbacteria) CG17_big_fil_post_rev_8_21_14_2_50_48_46]|uniref:Transport permease protein n=1 Tax=bacterium (Candidatus Blackallbacteria) CG17_big_fil_post_rev_8_21_14_2_50_48_46 TaxID=2014261 RepID=A0A2M7G836_9BACT|nr:MAG: multidrug ABC transporter permease [bacterium (Candidatus Blackallbacteria) CG18_big_fil_WC_8_21_14_2_50_49_26]PIW18234.1 MAG: ABC transporter permease [bacterium (Candidatus Blackallbacteria) CG17_big_fil_post_rev_8_21_14_2_50_48_46]PIW50665.1 MAG: ABC transporter permease [bacterium (Candidatus Blackallbacteria) CG13_big_fil_rev_8_21_14_2_50_49_14]
MNKFSKSFERFWSIFVARNYEFIRDRGTLAWSFLFPFLMLVGFSFTFDREHPPAQAKIGLVGSQSVQWQATLKTLPLIEVVLIENLEQARDKLAHHKLDLVLDTSPQPPVYFLSETSPKSSVAEKLVIRELEVREARPPPPPLFRRETLKGLEVPYLDWFFPGMLGMNIMFSAVFGVGYVIVRYRKNGMLKRLSATPLTAFEFLAAQLSSRLFLIICNTLILFGGSLLLFHFEVRGSWLALVLLFILGSTSLISLGLVVAARTESEELAGGLINLLTWPMMFFSEVWFSLEGAPEWLQKLALLFPLTHMIRGMRQVMNDGAGLAQVSGTLLLLLSMTLVFLSLGASLFRWRKV